MSGIGEVVRAALLTDVSRFDEHEAGVAQGDDDEDVHQARVATRRLRSDLRTFGPLLDPVWATPLRSELQWLGRMLGAVRDADVLRIGLEARLAEVAATDQAWPEPALARVRRKRSGAGLLATLAAERAAALDALRQAMAGDRYRAVVEAARLGAAAPVFAPGVDPEASAAAATTDLVERAFRRVARAVRRAGAEPPDPVLHDIRKRSKQARYAAEAAVPVLGREAAQRASAMKAVQELLGDHQDAVVAEAWLRRQVTGDADPLDTYVAGRLIAAEQGEQRRTREAWPAAWKAARAAYRS